MTVYQVAFLATTLIAGLLGGGIWWAKAMRAKIQAEADKLGVDKSVLMNEQTWKQLTRVERINKQLAEELDECKAHVRALESELESRGYKPPPWPPLKVVNEDD